MLPELSSRFLGKVQTVETPDEGGEDGSPESVVGSTRGGVSQGIGG
jgi:hypothetical protein